MSESLYNPEYGYYSSGKVEFSIGETKAKGHFTTSATEDTILAKQLATQAFMVWKTMLDAKDIKPDEQFIILELGAGEGLLSLNMISFCKRFCH